MRSSGQDMFSPDVTVHGSHALRNPRRRQRNSSEDPLASRPASKRRKRSSLTSSSFEPVVSNTKVNGHVPKINGNQNTKSQSPELPSRRGSMLSKTNLAVRHKQNKHEKERRASRQAEGLTLTRSSQYVVTKETAIPNEVQDIIRGKELWQARFNDDLGYVLILTHFKAVVWRYAQFNDHRETSRVYTVKLPQASSKPRDTLPLGTLIHDSVAGEMALLVLQNNGKINYWESVPGAAHADAMRQKQQAIQSSLSGLFSGEVISDITDAEPDGFILTSNASRIIHLSVRGPQGKLSISTEVLRGNSAIGSGFLNGIRSVFSSSGWRKDIAAARCASLQGKSHRKCIVVTKQCVFQIWDLRRHSTKTLEAEIDAKQIILDSIQSQSDNSRHEELQAIDFTFFPVYRNEQRDSQHLLLLVELKSPTSSRNFLVDLSLFGDALDINLLHRITCSDQISGDERPWLASRSRILLPHPAHSAIVVYDAAYVMVSLARVEDGPSSQLQRESHLLSEPFQDMLFFARERDFHVLGCASQSQSSESDHASFLMFVNNFGLVQTSITRAKEDEEPSVRRTTLCQSKIEQAVFFGDIPTRLFDFVRSSSIVDWQVEEIEQAALRINDSILASTSPYISVLNPSLENQLKDRSTALRELSKFIVRWSLGESVRWQLLWSAEKMAAARAIWQVYSTHLANRDEQQIDHNGENIVLLREAIEMISEKFKHVPHPEQGETDIVRHYFINDIANIELLIPWAAHALSELYREGLHDTVKQALLVNQANDIQINALETAFAFREQSAEMYGISKVSVEDGIYTGSYHSLPDFWTSCLENVVKVKDLAILSRECAIENEDPPEEGENVLDIAVLLKLARDAARLANLTCLIFEERYRTLQGRDDEESQSTLLNFEQKCLATRKELTVGLVDVELPEEGIRIAEKYNDVAALAEVITRSLAVIFDRMTDSDADPDEIIELRTKKNQYLEKTKMYFEKYGLRWADAFYSLRMQYPDSIPTLLKENDILMKEFLESKPELLKLKWMHEVGSQREFNGAAQDLLNLNSAEANLWNKKVELSMAKLSIFAAKEAQQANDDAVQRSARNADRRLAAIEVQELLYDYTRPVLGSALDRTAEVDLAMQTYGIALKKKPVLAESLRHSLEKLVKREALSEEGLVDILTLMHCPSQVLDDADVAGRRFFLALRVASTSAVEDEAFARFQQQTIWRRCVLQDNWEAINNTEYKADEAVSKETEGTALFKTLLAGFSEGFFDNVPPLAPSDLAQDDIDPASLRVFAKYQSASNPALEGLCRDLSGEVKAMAKAVQKGRLELWWKGIVDAVKARLREVEDKNGARLASQRQEKRKIEARLSEGKLPNGLTNGVHHSSSQEAEQDHEGDVVMS